MQVKIRLEEEAQEQSQAKCTRQTDKHSLSEFTHCEFVYETKEGRGDNTGENMKEATSTE